MLLAGSAVEPDSVSAFELAVFRVFNDAPGLPVSGRLAADAVRHVHHDPRRHAGGVALPQGAAGRRDRRSPASPSTSSPSWRRTRSRARGRERCSPTRISAASPAGQQGFPSGHAAVSAALAFILFAYLPGRWRWVPLALAVIVPAGRLYVGAHFPLDVVGGSVVSGIAAGALATFVGGVPDRRADRSGSDDER